VRMNGGNQGETRSSALWGTGNRGGESRSNALWGKGGRGALTALAALLAISVPLAASSPGKSKYSLDQKHAYIAPVLAQRAKSAPNTPVSVIVQSDPTFDSSKQKVTQVLRKAGVSPSRQLDLVGGLAVTMPAKWLGKLGDIKGLTVTPDAPVHVSGFSSKQLWPYETGLANGWSGPDAPAPDTVPTIAVVDSGIQAGRADFGNRLLAQVNFSMLPDNSPGDGRGHGTFVAGIAAGEADGYAGATPQAKLVALDVMDDHGVAKTSDVIAACQWILANKAKYNIRIANFSLHSATPGNFIRDPLDKAVEKLWFSGVFVVAAAGNYGTPDGPSGVPYAPGNDPFVMTVGAIDIGGTKNRKDDFPASWSAWGHTLDGFAKPEVVAPGRYMVGPVPAGSSLTVERPDKVTAPGYIQLSGTSFAAPVVAGAAAQILGKHPEFTPDQVKGALMYSAKPIEDAAPGSVGVGGIQMGKAALALSPPNPNKALDRFLVNDLLGGDVPTFDSVSWYDTAKSSVSWDSVSWSDVSWADVSWNDVSWADVSWSDVSWADVSWADVSWADVSWNDTSYEDAAEGDTSGDPNGYELTTEQAAEIMADPELAPPEDTLPAAVATALDDTTTSSPTDGTVPSP
jgi:serine protease AprX